MARFAGSELALRLRNELDAFGSAEQPLIDEYIGGNAGCFFAASRVAGDQG
jgi:hypothetical protein